MITEAIILAGGLGTRLRSVVADLPKCMAPVDGLPFIHFMVAYLEKEGIEKFIFSLGYKHEAITAYLDKIFPLLDKQYIIENIPLGTGGAIRKAAEAANNPDVFVLNGDTLFTIDTRRLAAFHEKSKADCTLALKEMSGFSRYGSVELFPGGAIRAFHEKRFCEKGYINGGLYAVHIPSILTEAAEEVFSFEKWLEGHAGSKKLFGDVYNNYFIDIGIPEDYQRFRDDHALLFAKQTTNTTSGNPLLTAEMGNFFQLLDKI